MSNSWLILRQKIALQREIDMLEQAKQRDENLMELIDSFALEIEHEGKRFWLRKDEIVNLNLNISMVNARIRMLKRQLDGLEMGSEYE